MEPGEIVATFLVDLHPTTEVIGDSLKLGGTVIRPYSTTRIQVK